MTTHETIQDFTPRPRAATGPHQLPRPRFIAPADLHARLAPPVAGAFDCGRLVRSLRVRVVLS